MKYAFYILFLSICVISNIANGKKFVYEKDTIEIQNCESTDSNESDVQTLHSLLNQSLADSGHSDLNSLRINHYLYLTNAPTDQVINCFSPPPEV
ncbi:hypothetical protein [Arundinibacter roseus]|uniref:Uncharacterized protein n=1 Tax=Arundinibacter roseus TaxID=2070510 RepID=A0A4R4KCP9_9BACT|nr:hypothetical protein [Arundinibacter roseus]TDB64612.1 hypothetical protein EZE20_13150 [Arundinibacter roseus]